MVQDLKFGNLCGTDFTGSTANKTGYVSSIGTYYGDCTTKTDGSTPSARGYLYDWAAAMNKANAYPGGSEAGCTGTKSETTCQGICPTGWHIPTGKSDGEYKVLHDTMVSAKACSNDACWNAGSAWEGVFGGYTGAQGTLNYQGTHALYWSSTYLNNVYAYYLWLTKGEAAPASRTDKMVGLTVRCVMN
jgi:uncharacterized protein (TIGR02145 family)